MNPIEDKRPDESLGAYLVRAREAHSLTVDDLSNLTKITVAHITAIEKGDWKAFPVEAYLRGYLNSLCSKLGLDSKKVMGWYTAESGSKYMNVSLDTTITSTISPMEEEHVKRHSKAIPVVIILLGLGFFAASHFMDRLSQSDEMNGSSNGDSVVAEDSVGDFPSEMPDGAEIVPIESLKADSSKKDSAARNDAVSQAVVDEAIKKSDLPASATIFISSTSKKDEKATVEAPVSAGGSTKIELIGSGVTRSWIGFKRHDDDGVFLKESNIVSNGARLVYNTKDTILVIIGEPRAVAKMFLNGVETRLPETPQTTGRSGVTRFHVFDGKIVNKGNE